MPKKARKPYPSELQERFIIRMPPNMREQLTEAARKNNRSMNAEVISRLEQSFKATGGQNELREDIISLRQEITHLRETITQPAPTPPHFLKRKKSSS